MEGQQSPWRRAVPSFGLDKTVPPVGAWFFGLLCLALPKLFKTETVGKSGTALQHQAFTIFEAIFAKVL
jgi:hypothetical protein